MKKLKLKKSGKIFIIVVFLIFFLIFHIVYKNILLSEYNSNYKKAKNLYKTGEILDNVKLTKVRASSYMFLSKNIKISIEYNDLEEDEGTYKIKSTEGIDYTLSYKEEDSKESAKSYISMIEDYNNLIKNKLDIFDSISKIRKYNNTLKRLLGNLPKYDEAETIDGKIFDGFMYKVEDKYTYVLYGNNKKITLIFDGSKLNLEYLTYLISTIEVE